MRKRLSLSLAALATMAALAGPRPAAAQQDVERCFQASLADVGRCEVDVLETGGLFCPDRAEIRERVCDRLRQKQGETVDVRCEGEATCTSTQPISGTVTRTFELSRQKMTCSVTFRLTVRATLAGTGSIGRCATGAAT